MNLIEIGATLNEWWKISNNLGNGSNLKENLRDLLKILETPEGQRELEELARERPDCIRIEKP